MKKITFLLLLSISFTSCIRIVGFTNDYKKLSEAEKSTITPLSNFEEVKKGRIHKINAAQLRDEIKNHPKALVYMFVNGCASESCRPMYVYENYAKENGYQLFLVMSGYGNLHETTEQSFISPLFAIDNDYYGSNFKPKFTRLFENDLLDRPADYKEKDFLGTLYFFENGKFVSQQLDLPQEFLNTNNYKVAEN